MQRSEAAVTTHQGHCDHRGRCRLHAHIQRPTLSRWSHSVVSYDTDTCRSNDSGCRVEPSLSEAAVQSVFHKEPLCDRTMKVENPDFLNLFLVMADFVCVYRMKLCSLSFENWLIVPGDHLLLQRDIWSALLIIAKRWFFYLQDLFRTKDPYKNKQKEALTDRWSTTLGCKILLDLNFGVSVPLLSDSWIYSSCPLGGLPDLLMKPFKSWMISSLIISSTFSYLIFLC